MTNTEKKQEPRRCREVPHQLAGEMFIVLSQNDKRPIHQWSDPAKQYTAEKIQTWIDADFNYAVLYKTDLAVVDADNAEKLAGCLASLTPTYTVKSGRRDSTGKHLYFRVGGEVPEPFTEKKILLEDPDTGEALGDIRLPHSPFYNVAPYSYHPSGRQYLPEDPAAEVKRVTFEELYTALSHFIKQPTARTKRATVGTEIPAPSRFNEYGYTCLDFLRPLNPSERDGNIEGVHPIHGSSTGSNLAVSVDGSVWYCRRCNSGGDWLKALAVSEGIIDCSEAGRPFTHREWDAVNRVLRRLNPKVWERQYVERRRSKARRTPRETNKEAVR